jgi:hypothetical protein
MSPSFVLTLDDGRHVRLRPRQASTPRIVSPERVDALRRALEETYASTRARAIAIQQALDAKWPELHTPLARQLAIAATELALAEIMREVEAQQAALLEAQIDTALEIEAGQDFDSTAALAGYLGRLPAPALAQARRDLATIIGQASAALEALMRGPGTVH